MSSANLAIRIVGVEGKTLEFWAAEVPLSSRWTWSTNMGGAHPCVALLMIAAANRYDNALARELEGQDIFRPEWLEANTATYVSSMELVGQVPLMESGEGLLAALDRSSGATTLALLLERAPRALYRVRVTDERWLAHLAAGQEFESTASSPFSPVQRTAEYPPHLETVKIWDPILELIDGLQSSGSFHVIRNALYQTSWLQVGDFDEGEYKQRPVPNRLREIFLRCGGAFFVYLDASAPRFNPSKHPFVEGHKRLGAAYAKMRLKGHAAGPYGFDLAWRPPLAGADGVKRADFDVLSSEARVARLEFQGAPTIRLGTLFPPAVEPGGVSLEVYLQRLVERTRADIERLGA